jgi:5-methylcytosine-specific restriction endonuclease McrA
MRHDRSTVHRDALLLRVMETDTQAMRREDGWVTPCLHCRSTLAISAAGVPLGAATLEHIVPRGWFRRTVARDLVERVGKQDDLRNLALACARCNHQKGKSHDAEGPTSARAREVISALLDARAARMPPDGRS